MSAKWRRSRRHLKWVDPKNLETHPKTLRIEKLKASRSVYPQKRHVFRSYQKGKWKAPKPLIDIFQEQSWITIVAEIVGFNKETMKINVKDQKITLSAKAKDRRYYKSLNLPKVVIPNVMHTTYKNGVLEKKLKKAIKEQIPNQKDDEEMPHKLRKT